MSSAPKKPTGRPSKFSDELAATICERIANGESLVSICDSDGMPDKSTVFRWLSNNATFRDNYARARETQADVLFDEIVDISDDGRNDWMERHDDEGGNIGWRENGEALARSRLRIDARKWVAGKLRPKVYGDKVTQEVSGPGGGPIEVADARSRVADRLAALGGASGLATVPDKSD